MDLVARATAGSSGAELANIVNEAALRAVRMKRNRVTTNDLEESVETVIAGAQKKEKSFLQTKKNHRLSRNRPCHGSSHADTFSSGP